MENDALHKFLTTIADSINKQTFVKLTLSKSVGEEKSLKNIYAKLIQLKNEWQLSFTYRYDTKDEVKNFEVNESIILLEHMMGNTFLNADLYTTDVDMSLQYTRKRRARLFSRKPSHTEVPKRQHNQTKNYLISPEDNLYLQELGIVNATGKVLNNGQKKFRQINKYIEIIDHILKQKALPDKAHIVDMGSGKGYLTFALYDYLHQTLQKNIKITGIELRPHLVEAGNALAQKNSFEQLHFVAQDINDFDDKIDMLIALHACDTATDIAIAKGIRSKAEIIIVAPCCHKQVRKDMSEASDFNSILQHGILKERQAEILTDTIRSLLLEAHGYSTKVFEFISTEHTPKNLMIVATKAKPQVDARKKVAHLKESFGIQKHYLEEILS